MPYSLSYLLICSSVSPKWQHPEGLRCWTIWVAQGFQEVHIKIHTYVLKGEILALIFQQLANLISSKLLTNYSVPIVYYHLILTFFSRLSQIFYYSWQTLTFLSPRPFLYWCNQLDCYGSVPNLCLCRREGVSQMVQIGIVSLMSVFTSWGSNSIWITTKLKLGYIFEGMQVEQHYKIGKWVYTLLDDAN